MSGLDPAAGTTAPAGAGPGGLEPEERPKPITPPWASRTTNGIDSPRSREASAPRM